MLRVIAFAALIGVSFAALDDCFQSNGLYQTEAGCLEYIQGASVNDLGFKREMIPLSMKKGWWGVSEQLVAAAQELNINVESDIDMALRMMNQEAKKLKKYLSTFKSPVMV